MTDTVCTLKPRQKMMLNLFTDARENHTYIMAIQSNTASVQVWEWRRRKNFQFLALLTITVFEDDPYKISSKHFIVVYYPQRLHFRIHVSTLLNTRRKHNKSLSQIRIIQLKRPKHCSKHSRTHRLPGCKCFNAISAFILLLCYERLPSCEHIWSRWNVLDTVAGIQIPGA